MATYYIANYGNNLNNGSSWNLAWKNIYAANNILRHYDNYYLDGYFDDLPHINRTYKRHLYGVNNTKIDGKNYYNTTYFNNNFYHLEIFNFKRFVTYVNGSVGYCYFHDISEFYSSLTDRAYIYQCIFNNVNRIYFASYIIQYSNNTVHNCSNVYLRYLKKHFIFSNCTISINTASNISYSLFINCSFKITGSGTDNDETEYTYPIGDTDEEKMENLRERIAYVYSRTDTESFFKFSKYYSGDYNDIFVDADNGNFSLVPGCIAETMSEFGTKIGATNIGITTNIDQSILNNIGTSGYIQNNNIDAIYDSNIIDFGKVRKVTKFNILYDNFKRNSFYINTDSNLGEIIYEGDNVLTDGIEYVNINNEIEINNTSKDYYVKWDTFITNAEADPNNGLGFRSKCFEYGIYSTNGTCGTNSTSGTNGTDGTECLPETIIFDSYCGTNGAVQEILFDKLQIIKIKCSKTNSTLDIEPELTMFLSDTPMVNVNVIGEPIYGNADENFNSETATPLYTRYIKLTTHIKSNTLSIK